MCAKRGPSSQVSEKLETAMLISLVFCMYYIGSNNGSRALHKNSREGLLISQQQLNFPPHVRKLLLAFTILFLLAHFSFFSLNCQISSTESRGRGEGKWYNNRKSLCWFRCFICFPSWVLTTTLWYRTISSLLQMKKLGIGQESNWPEFTQLIVCSGKWMLNH